MAETHVARPFLLREAASRVLSRVIFGALLALVPLTAIPYGAVEPWWEAVFEMAVFALAALWAIEGALAGRWLARGHDVLAPLIALAVYMLVQTLPLAGGTPTSYDPYETRLVALKLLALTLYAALLIRYTTDERRLRALLFTVIGTALACALFGIIRQTTQRGERGFLLARLMPGSGYAQFINKNHFAYLAEAALGLALGLIAARGVARERWLSYAALAIPVWAALILANSRGGVFAMLCQLIFLALVFDISRREIQPTGAAPFAGARRRGWAAARRIGLVVCLLAAVAVGMAWVGGDPLAERMESVRDEVVAERTEPSRTGRPDIWRATWELIKEHPLAGVGFGGYRAAIPASHHGNGLLVPQQAHSDYLELLASGGLLGAALAIWFFVLLIRRARASLRSRGAFGRAAAAGALAGLFGIAVHSTVEFGLHVTVNAVVFAALVAVAAADVRAAPKAAA